MIRNLDSPEQRINTDRETPESETLRKLKGNKDGSLGAFGKMLDTFISDSWLFPDKIQWAQWLKKEYMKKAKTIMEDPTLNIAWQNNALQKLFGTFKENKEFFPTPTEQVQSAKSGEMQYEGSKDDFYEKFLKALAERDEERWNKSREREQASKTQWDREQRSSIESVQASIAPRTTSEALWPPA